MCLALKLHGILSLILTVPKWEFRLLMSVLVMSGDELFENQSPTENVWRADKNKWGKSIAKF